MKSLLFFLLSTMGIILIGNSQSISGADSVKHFLEQLKHQPITKKETSFISMGADLRWQYFAIKNENWGDMVPNHDSYLLTRSLFHFDLTIKKYFRTYLQLQSSLAADRVNKSPLDDNALEWHQAFVEIIPFRKENRIFTIRMGRQEFLYGSQRLVTVREGPNSRLSFDAARIILQSGSNRLEAFYASPVIAKTGIFNDEILSNSIKFWGTYLTLANNNTNYKFDLYYLGYSKSYSIFNDGTGTEKRHSVGSRVWGKFLPLEYDLEAVYQFGNFAEKTIHAWTASIDLDYKINTNRWNPEIGFKTEIISGDKMYGDQKLQTFNPLFPRGGYFGLAALIGPSNLVDMHPSIAIQPLTKLTMMVDYDLFWRYRKQDGIYAANVQLIYPHGDSDDKHIGNQLSASINWSTSKYLSLSAEFSWFKAGNYLKNVGTGRDIFFGGLTTHLKF